MQDLLKQFAIRDLWCEPRQDQATHIQLARLTPKGGGYKTASVIRQHVNLPNINASTDKATYHVYQVGQLPPRFFNLATIPEDTRYTSNVSTQSDGQTTSPIPATSKSFVIPKTGVWYPIVGLCVANATMIDIYTSNGTKLPRHECWLQRMTDRTFILAVRIMPNYDMGYKTVEDTINGGTKRIRRTLDNETLHIRFYSNARFDEQDWRENAIDPITPIRVLCQSINSLTDYTSYAASVEAIQTHFGSRGKGITQQDGYITHTPTAYSSEFARKVFSFVYDESIKEVSTYLLSGLTTFESDVDLYKTKYVIIRPATYDMIDFYDDVDFYLIRRATPTTTQFKGVYVGKLRSPYVRQLTHNSYALHKEAIDALIAADDVFSTGQLEIMLVVREGGMVRGLAQQHTRIEELYRLTPAQIVEAMTSASNTTVPEWHAVNLEKNAYAMLMGTKYENITNALVEDAYGYNAASRLMADPICLLEPLAGDPLINVPLVACIPEVGNIAPRSVYCYDNEGKLLGYFQNIGIYETLAIPEPFKANTALTECFALTTTGGNTGIYFGNNLYSPGLAHYGFRCYACPVVNGIPTEHWEDVTNSAYYIYLPDGNPEAGDGIPCVLWNQDLLDDNNLFACTKEGRAIHWFEAPDIPASHYNYVGYMSFTVTAQMFWDGNLVVREQTLPPGVVDVFMNGECLIRNLDYYIKWPEIVVVKKPAVDLPDVSIKVRSYGFCKRSTMQPHLPRDQHFVKGGILSVNGQYDVRNDRNLHINVAGRLKTRQQVSFSETDTVHRVTDGRPYAVSDYVLPVESYTTKITNEYRDASVDMDDRVADYLESRLPTWHPTLPTVEIERWELYSPFCSGLLHGIRQGVLGGLAGTYSDVDVDNFVTPWKWLLDFDPCVQGFDGNFVIVHAHQFDELIHLTMEQYRFMERVIARYLNNVPDLTPLVVIGG